MDQIKIVAYSFERMETACGYIRLLSPFESIRSEVEYAWGVSCQQNPIFKRKVIHGGFIDFADLIVVQRTFPQERTVKTLKKFLESGKAVIYDIDDLLIDLPADHVNKDFIDKCRPFIIEFISQVDAITVSTPALGDVLKPYNANIYLLPNLVDDCLWSDSSLGNTDRIVIGFGGTSTHANDIALVEEALLAIADKYRDSITFKFLGCVTERLARLPCVEYVDFQPSYRDYAQVLQNAGFDIAIVPLENNLFNNCKSNIKWLEYSACGIPGIYSDLLPYNSSVESGKTGLLAGNSSKDWFEAMDLLISDREMRKRIGAAARTEVLANYSLGNKAHNNADLYRRIIQVKQLSRAGKGSSTGRFLRALRWSPFAG